MALGILMALCCYILYWVVAGLKSISLLDNVLFLSCACMFNSGIGLHTGCVVMETNIQDLGMGVDSLSALVNFMHEYWSHNTLLFGLFGMLLLIVWKEVCCLSKNYILDSSQSKKEQVSAVRSTQKETMTNTRQRMSHFNKTPNNASTKTTKAFMLSDFETGMVYYFFMQWVFPLIIGLFFSIFSRATSTEILTVCFFIAILAIFIAARKKLKEISLTTFLKCLSSDSELTLLDTMSKCAVVGLLFLVFCVMF